MRRTLLSFAFALILLITAVHLLNWPVTRGIERVVHPLGRTLHQAGSWLYAAGAELPRLGRLQSAITEAEREVSRLRLRSIELERLREENRQLRTELGLQDRYEQELLYVDVINLEPDRNRDMMRIAAGSRDSLSVDMPVLAEGVLIGVINGVDEHTSQVLLVSDASFRAVVQIGDASGVLRGQVGGGMVVERLPRNQGITEGDIVMTSGEDGVFPPGLLVGTVGSLAQAPGGIFDTAQITAEGSARGLQVVGVIKR